jgi:hypothetical protein
MNLNHTSPQQVENLNGLQIYSIEDVSKGDKQVVISLVILFFVEKLKTAIITYGKMV